jgi:inhibitor of KinA
MWKSIKAFGRCAVLIEWSQDINIETNKEITSLSKSIESKKINGVIDIVPAYASLTVFYEPEIINFDQIVALINKIAVESVENTHISGKIWEIQVNYSNGSERDMHLLLKHTGLSRNEIIDIHTSIEYIVYFIGFLPGFLYLGGLSERLHIPRKAIPDLRIPAGSVAIGGAQTGIYPQESPGGWYVIGQTDFNMIDFYTHPFCQVKPGDKVKFSAI